MIKRTLILAKYLSDTDILLLGPRQMGKLTLLAENFKTSALVVNLLESDAFLSFCKEPSLIRDVVNESTLPLVIIDEIQKIPELLNEVHLLIEQNKKKKFYFNRK